MAEENPEKEKIRLLQISYTSEWALAKFFPAIFDTKFNKEIINDFELVGVCGRENNLVSVLKKLHKGYRERTGYLLKGEAWRASNINAEMNSIDYLFEPYLTNKNYFQIVQNNNIVLPKIDYDVACIFSCNTTHLDYIKKLIKAKKDIICEKPLVVVTDKNHKADRTQLNELEKIVNSNDAKELVLMDAEHYSAKKASLIFYENLEEMIGKYGKISSIKGWSKEKDMPEKERTIAMLNRKNRTGLLLDMGVHYIGIISNIDGKIEEINTENRDFAEYDKYPGDGGPEYDVETHVKTRFRVSGELFHENASAEFEFTKFIDKKQNPEEKDDKKYVITFKKIEDGKEIETTVTLNFRTGEVISSGSESRDWKDTDNKYSENEYVNILNEYKRAKQTKTEPRTSFRRSINTLDAIYRLYEAFPVDDNITRIYKTSLYK